MVWQEKGDLMKCRLGSLPLLSIMGAALCLFVACGESESSTNANGTGEIPVESSPSTDSGSNVVEVPQINSDSLIAADAENPKPCSAEENGAFAWINVGESFYRCENGVWAPYKVAPHKRGFDPCQFNFGTSWQANWERDSTIYAGLDYIVVWLGDNDYYNDFEKRLVTMCTKVHATPMIYAYVIAEYGKEHGLVDCNQKSDVHPKTHCTDGANIIREYFADSILYRYREYASGMREQLEFYLDEDPDTFESIWLIEPDYYQYSETASKQKDRLDGNAQNGGGIPDSMMGVYFGQIVDTIRAYLPAAKIVVDISPWIGDIDTMRVSTWYSNFDMSKIDYAGTSGGGTMAATVKIRSGNKMTWRQIHEITGKPILADAGYDVGGQGTGHIRAWDSPVNILARMADGVVGVVQMDAAKDFPVRADTIRPQLNYTYPWCED